MFRMLTFALVTCVASVAFGQCQQQQQAPQISALDLQLLQRNTPAQLPAATTPSRNQVDDAVKACSVVE